MAEEESSGEGSEYGFILAFVAVLIVAWMLTNFRKDSTNSFLQLHSTSTPAVVKTAPKQSVKVVPSDSNSSELDAIEQRVREIDSEVRQLQQEQQ